MPAWLLPAALSVGAGLLGASGQAKANKSNERMARERMAFEDKQAARQMDFQREMSSTAAQRSVADFKAAGLNPALAYGTTATTPSGASGSGAQSVAENVAEAGLSSARQTASVRQALEIAKLQSAADLELKKAQTLESGARAATTLQQGDLYHGQLQNILQQTSFMRARQPADVRKAFADALLSEYSVPSASNTADLARRLGIWQPAIGTLFSGSRSINELLRIIRR